MAAAAKAKSSLYFLIGAWILVAVAVGHTLGTLREPSTGTSLVYEGMKRVQPMEMSRHSLYDFYRANNYVVGLMNLGFGLVGVLLARHFRKRGERIPKQLVTCFLAVTAVEAVIAVLFYPVPPIVFLVSATALFVVAVL